MFNRSSRQEAQETESPESMSGAQDNDKPDEFQPGPSASSESANSPDLAALQEKHQQLQDQFTRLAADFDNYRKRTRDEQESLAKYGAQKNILELLPVLDNLERATGSLKEDSDPKLLYKSFSMMHRQLMDGLDNMGVKKIPSIGQVFDPLQHEAVSQMNSAEFPEDTIIHEVQSGYQLFDKVLRPARVIVSTGAPEASAPETAKPAAASGEPAQTPVNPFAQS
ncbi:nucleotide exchange factor GrpE [Vampirovibrio chlorellavorus]|uniref:nucleotide exchange factor GrpE n=1 Tax=Vampirovibrio chlorellavorus TaxID=758823 RepID=UPI0026EE1A94|nr:nucleotide exchange factor GrpE [Vampirovibrio chlorellavorus]